MDTVLKFMMLLMTLQTLQPRVTSTERVTYVSPNGVHCIQHPCLDFRQLIEDYEYYFVSGKTIQFLPGNYTVDDNTYLIVKNISNFVLLGMSSNTSSSSPVIFHCNGQLSFIFMNVINLRISGIQLIRCGLPIPSNVAERMLPVQEYSRKHGIQAALLFVNVHSLHIKRLHIQESSGFGLLALNVLGKSEISSSTFDRNNYYVQLLLTHSYRYIYEACQETYGSFTPCIGGSMYFLFQDTIKCPANNTVYELDITSVKVLSGASADAYLGITNNTGSSGLSLTFEQTSYGIKFTLNETNFQSNHGMTQGAGVLVQIFKYAADSELYIQNCVFSNTNMKWYRQRRGYWALGSIISYKNDYKPLVHVNPLCKGSMVKQKHVKLVVSDCQFINNAAMDEISEGFVLAIKVISGFQESQVLITNTEFNNNKGSAVNIVADGNGSTTTQAGNVWIKHSTFSSNTAAAVKVFLNRNSNVWKEIGLQNATITKNSGQRQATVAILGGDIRSTSVVITQTHFLHNKPQYTFNTIDLVNVNNVTFIDCVFYENFASAVYANGSKIYFNGNTIFHSNQGQYGGALALALASAYHLDQTPDNLVTSIHLYPDAHLYMINNSATQRGGAIYIEEPLSGPLTSLFPCHPPALKFEGSNSYIMLDSNKALIAGDSIYGLVVIACLVHPDNPDPQSQYKAFNTVFMIINQPSSSEVAATPKAICICDSSGQTDCSSRPIGVSVYPGQTFFIPAIATGDTILHGAVPGLVNTRIAFGHQAHLGVRQEGQILGRTCTNVTLSVSTSESNIQLLLSVERHFGIQVSLKEERTLKLTLLSCPAGFKLQGEQSKCACAPRLTEHNCSCSIDELAFQCPLHTWIGNHSGGIILHKHCSLDYCVPETPAITLENLDRQCQFNRTGILCGGCQLGVSLALGTSQCLQCSSLYLLLIPVFILAGLGLVMILLLCNLTVSTGTINGLIYSVNIIQVNHSTFFPKNNTVLAVFIAWLNLDFGIQTCFYNGMDMYAKAWLQFIFPVYIWVIVSFIIIASRYSILLSRLTGSNSVQVLATLFLLSYAKLLRTIITVLSFTHLTYSDASISPVWLYDGNVPFIKGKHAALFGMALIATLGFMVPYTMLLLLSPYLQARSAHPALRWVNRLKPFLDAYHGPYKDKFRNWTGMMLIARVAQFVIFAFNVQGDPNVNLLVIIIFSALILTVLFNLGRPYKNKLNNLLESFLILKLGVYAATVLHFRTLGTSSLTQYDIATNVIVSISFLIFWLIVAYHTYPIGKRLWIKLRCQACARQQPVQDVMENMDNSIGSAYDQSQPPTVSYIELREVLLEAAM